MPTYHHGDLKAALLEAAGRILEREGIQALSVREAARRAGVSHNAPYRHFPDRQALLDALAEESARQLAASLEEQAPRDVALAYVRYAMQHPERFRLLLAGHPEIERCFARAVGDLGPLAGASAWALAHGLAVLLVSGRLGGDEALARQVLGAVRFVQRSA